MKRRPTKVSKEVRARRKWIASLPCMICGRRPSEPHHVKARGMGGKRPDDFDVANLTPLCADHHRLAPEAVERGRERFEERFNVDLTEEAEKYEIAYRMRGMP
jgi:hypothetical protein